MTALQLAAHLAYDEGWSRIQQPWSVIELVSTDPPVSLVAVSSAGGRATQPYDGGLGNSLRTRRPGSNCLKMWKAGSLG